MPQWYLSHMTSSECSGETALMRRAVSLEPSLSVATKNESR